MRRTGDGMEEALMTLVEERAGAAALRAGEGTRRAAE